jgi:hypothetical protein
MESILHLNYKIDKEILLAESVDARKNAIPYTDSRYPNLKLNDWLVSYHTSDYVESVMKDFGISGKPRFYWLQPYAVIPEHVDNGTLCGLNFILTDNASPITFGDKDYLYEAALVDTTVPHSVKNNNHERVMFKISIFNKRFEEVAEQIKSYML